LALPIAGLLLLHRGATERATEVYALASTLPHVANGQWYSDVIGKPIAEAADTLPAAVASAAKERGLARDLWATAEELLVELQGSTAETQRARS
jgi:hypothetical protein